MKPSLRPYKTYKHLQAAVDRSGRFDGFISAHFTIQSNVISFPDWVAVFASFLSTFSENLLGGTWMFATFRPQST